MAEFDPLKSGASHTQIPSTQREGTQNTIQIRNSTRTGPVTSGEHPRLSSREQKDSMFAGDQVTTGQGQRNQVLLSPNQEVLMGTLIRTEMKEQGDTSNEQANDTEKESNEASSHPNQARGSLQIKQQNTTNKPRTGKKCVFQNWQKDILKKWFISHVDHPYLNEKSKLKLMQQTGLDGKKIANWFMNVRKRIWQPVMKKNKNKNTKEVMLKVKFKLDSSESRSDRASSAHSRNHAQQAESKGQKIVSQTKTKDPGAPHQLFHVGKVAGGHPPNGDLGDMHQQEPNTHQAGFGAAFPEMAALQASIQQEASELLTKRKNPFFSLNGFEGFPDFFPKDNKRQEKEDRKLEKFLNDESKRSAIRTFVNHSKSLRFSEKMHNVMVWKKNQMKYAATHQAQIDSPGNDEDVDSTNKLAMIQKIEDQFANKKFKFSEADQQSQSQANLYKERSTPRLPDANERSSAEYPLQHAIPSGCDDEEFVSLPRSKSLSNNRSRSSMCQFPEGDAAGLHRADNATGSPFMPIVLICCPTILKGKKCSCGYNGYYPANDFYKNQLSQQNTNGNLDSSGSGAWQSGSGGNARGGHSGSDPSNQQESGQSWRTTEANPLNFINLLNQVTCLADIVQRHAMNLVPASKSSTQEGDNKSQVIGGNTNVGATHAKSQNGGPPPDTNLNQQQQPMPQQNNPPVALQGSSLRKANSILSHVEQLNQLQNSLNSKRHDQVSNNRTILQMPNGIQNGPQNNMMSQSVSEQQRLMNNMPQTNQMGQAANASVLNGTLNKLKSLITKNSVESKPEAPTPNFAHKNTNPNDMNNQCVQREANRLQSIIYNLNSIFQKNGLNQNYNQHNNQIINNLAPNGQLKQVVGDNQSKQNMGQLGQSLNLSQNQNQINQKDQKKFLQNKYPDYKQNKNQFNTPPNQNPLERGFSGQNQIQQQQNTSTGRLETYSDSNVTQLIDNAKQLVQIIQNQMAGGSNGGGGTNPNSGSGRSNVDSLSTLSKRNATNGLNSSFFQSGTTREPQNDSKNSFNYKMFNQNNINNNSSTFGQQVQLSSNNMPQQNTKISTMTFDGSQTSHHQYQIQQQQLSANSYQQNNQQMTIQSHRDQQYKNNQSINNQIESLQNLQNSNEGGVGQQNQQFQQLMQGFNDNYNNTTNIHQNMSQMFNLSDSHKNNLTHLNQNELTLGNLQSGYNAHQSAQGGNAHISYTSGGKTGPISQYNNNLNQSNAQNQSYSFGNQMQELGKQSMKSNDQLNGISANVSQDSLYKQNVFQQQENNNGTNQKLQYELLKQYLDIQNNQSQNNQIHQQQKMMSSMNQLNSLNDGLFQNQTITMNSVVSSARPDAGASLSNNQSDFKINHQQNKFSANSGQEQSRMNQMSMHKQHNPSNSVEKELKSKSKQ